MHDMQRIMVFDRLDAYVCDIDPAQVLSAKVTEEVNGEHSLTLTTLQELEQTDRVLLQDGMGTWHEYVVLGIKSERPQGEAVAREYYCVWSIQYDLSATYINDQLGCGVVPGHTSVPQTPRRALECALAGTSRWQIGTITVTTQAAASFYRRSGWEGLQTVIERWGGELQATIEVSLGGVTARRVDLLEHVGRSDATRRFDYGHDLAKIKQTVHDEVWPCRIVPLGKSVETEAGGYTRRPGIESVNDGVEWLQDDDVAPLVRVPDGDGGWEYPTAIVKNDTYELPADLKAWAVAHISEYTRPRVTYEANVAQFAQAGLDPHGVALGDEVVCVDRTFCEGGLRITARVVKIKRDLLDPSSMELTIGNAQTTLAGQLSAIAGDVTALGDETASASDYQASAAYMAALVGRLNDEINASGGYWYMVPGIGTRTYDVPVSDPAVGSEASRIVEIRGGTIRIADSRTSSGDWDWTNVFTADGINSELVRAVQIEAGYIGNLAGSGNYWDLDTGEFRLASTANLGGKTVQQVIDGVDATITAVDVQYAQNQSATTAPTSGWSTTAPAWRDGYYIWQRTATTTPEGTDYSTPVMISGRDGTNGTSVTIKGSYNSYADLIAAHPTGSDGDAYMVGTDLYVWNGTQWEDVGQIQGPPGTNGTNGTDGSQIWTATANPTTPNYTFAIANLTGPSGVTPRVGDIVVRSYYRYTITSVGATTVLAGTRTSIRGAAGADGKSVFVQSVTKVDGVTTVVLSDGTTQSTLTIDDGGDGPRGLPGTNGTNSYVHIAWANSADGTEGFSTTVSAGKSYLGVYSDEQEDDSTNPADYSWSRIEGQPGEPGADGVGITSIVEQYYLSTSSSTQSGGSWVTTPPAYVAGRYYWTRSVITWDDGTTTITSAVLARGLNSANSTAAQAKSTAESAQADVDALSTQDAIFNLLTDNGAIQGLYMLDGQLYVNASYINGGYINGDLVRGGTIAAGGANNVNGIIQVQDASGNVISQLDKDGATLAGDSTLVKRGIRSAGTNLAQELRLCHEIITSGSNYYLVLTGYVSSIQYYIYGTRFERWAQDNSSSDLTKKNDIIIVPSNQTGSQYHSSIAATDNLRIISHYEELVASPSSSSVISGQLDLKDTGAQLGVYTGNFSFRSRVQVLDGEVNVRVDPNKTAHAMTISKADGITMRLATKMTNDLTVSGTKSRLAQTEHYGDRLLYAYETPAPMFGDLGSGTIGEDGTCYVQVDDIFCETVSAAMEYQVFLQKCGPGDLWVAEKRPGWFVVEGTPGLAFDWELKAHQAGYEHERLEDDGMQAAAPYEGDDIEAAYAEDMAYAETIERLQMAAA